MQIATFLGGELVGNPMVTVNSLTKIEEGKPGGLSFLSNPKYSHYLYDSDASIIIVSKNFEPERQFKATLIKVDDPYASFATILNLYQETKQKKKIGISSLAFIHESAKIGENVFIGEFVYVGENAIIGNNSKIYPQSYIGENVKVGSDCLIYPSVKILDDSIIGNECTFHSGVVIGSDGFGFAPQQDTDFKKVAQIGNVIIEDRVELGANTTVDRATMGSTIIRRGVKLDNLCQIAHNVDLGENTVMAAQSGIAGSTKIGKNCMFGGQVAINGHITIAPEVKLAAKTGVAGAIKNVGEIQMGIPSFDHKDFIKSHVYFKKLPALVKRIEELENKIKNLGV